MDVHFHLTFIVGEKLFHFYKVSRNSDHCSTWISANIGISVDPVKISFNDDATWWGCTS